MLDLLIAANSKRIAKLPKVARVGLAGLLAYTSAVGIVNLAPEKMNYVPVLSNVTPVLAQVTQAGVTRTELISHTEFTRINEEGAQVQQVLTEIEQNIDDAVSETVAEIQSISAGSGEWIEDDFVDEYTYANTVVRDGELKMNHIVYSDGLEGVLLLDSDNTGVYSTSPTDGGQPHVSNVTWHSYRNGTVVIEGEDFTASFSSGKDFAFNF